MNCTCRIMYTGTDAIRRKWKLQKSRFKKEIPLRSLFFIRENRKVFEYVKIQENEMQEEK